MQTKRSFWKPYWLAREGNRTYLYINCDLRNRYNKLIALNYDRRSKMNFNIKEDDIHVWGISFSDFTDNIEYLTSFLSGEELERSKTYKFPMDERKFILARGILKYLLAKYLDLQIQKINIFYGLWGKPHLTQKNKLYFNLSHSGNYVLYAFTRFFEVGIDLEYIDRSLPLDDMVSIILSKADLIYWETLGQQEKLNHFFKYWVYKEAFLKASGQGWVSKEPTLSFKEVVLLSENSIFEELSTEATHPYFFNYVREYASALYVNGPSLRTRFFSLSHI